MASFESSIDNHLTGSAFGVDVNSLSAAERKELDSVAAEILSDPLMLQQLSDRVYQLMQDNLYRQQERQGRYWSRRHGR